MTSIPLVLVVEPDSSASEKTFSKLHLPKMYVCTLTQFSAVVAIVTSLVEVVSCGPTTPRDILSRTPAAGIDVKSLSPYLSSASKIYLPGSDKFTNYTVRWSNLEPPTPSIVIAPGTEKDVAQIVSTSQQVDFALRVTNVYLG